MPLNKNTLQMQGRTLNLPATLIRVIACACAMGLAGCTHAPQQPRTLTKTAGDLTVSFTTDPWPVHSGDDTAIVTLTSAGQQVDDASVVVSANMKAPLIQGAPASGRFRGDGQYEAPIRLVATSYDLDVHVERLNRPAVDVTFPLEAWQ